MTDPCGGNVPGGEGCTCDPPFARRPNLATDAKAIALGSDAVAAGMWVTTEDGPRYVDLTDAEQVAWWRAQVDADSAP